MVDDRAFEINTIVRIYTYIPIGDDIVFVIMLMNRVCRSARQTGAQEFFIFPMGRCSSNLIGLRRRSPPPPRFFYLVSPKRTTRKEIFISGNAGVIPERSPLSQCLRVSETSEQRATVCHHMLRKLQPRLKESRSHNTSHKEFYYLYLQLTKTIKQVDDITIIYVHLNGTCRFTRSSPSP